jgi:hypothetical protein
MKLHFTALATAAAVAGITAMTAPASAAVLVGQLSCQVAPSVGYVIGSERDMRCLFRPANGGRPHRYVGRAGRLGIDVGYTRGGILQWSVFASTNRFGPRDLAGNYAGGFAAASFGPGLGANALVGGSAHTFALQPLSGEASEGLNVAAGVTELQLR